MVEKLIEAKAFIDAGELEAAKAKIDEVIASMSQAKVAPKPDPTDPPLPGQGNNGPY